MKRSFGIILLIVLSCVTGWILSQTYSVKVLGKEMTLAQLVLGKIAMGQYTVKEYLTLVLIGLTPFAILTLYLSVCLRRSDK